MRPLTAAWKAAMHGLTVRGRSFLAAGAAAAVCAIVLGQRDLLRIAVLLLVLPTLCGLALARAQFRLALSRTVMPHRVVAGSSARVRLELENLTRFTTRLLLAEERVPYTLGAPPRFVVDRLSGKSRVAVTYALRSEVRGRFEVGPLRLRLRDAFGMCEMTRSFTATDPLVVVPRSYPLSAITSGGVWAGVGESLARTAAASGEDDLATREYRHGDDLRRVHWRSTAHHGELMVRTDEQPRQMRATIILDSRDRGHRGEGPASSLEWAISAAASVAVHLSGQRFGVRVLDSARVVRWTDRGETAGAILDDLAELTSGPPGNLSAAMNQITGEGGEGLLVAILGEVGPDDVRPLLGLARQGQRGAAVLLRTTSWAYLPQRLAAQVDGERARTAALLRSAGWAVTESGPEETIVQAWARLTRAGRHGLGREDARMISVHAGADEEAGR